MLRTRAGCSHSPGRGHAATRGRRRPPQRPSAPLPLRLHQRHAAGHVRAVHTAHVHGPSKRRAHRPLTQVSHLTAARLRGVPQPRRDRAVPGLAVHSRRWLHVWHLPERQAPLGAQACVRAPQAQGVRLDQGGADVAALASHRRHLPRHRGHDPGALPALLRRHQEGVPPAVAPPARGAGPRRRGSRLPPEAGARLPAHASPAAASRRPRAAGRPAGRHPSPPPNPPPPDP